MWLVKYRCDSVLIKSQERVNYYWKPYCKKWHFFKKMKPGRHQLRDPSHMFACSVTATSVRWFSIRNRREPAVKISENIKNISINDLEELASTLGGSAGYRHSRSRRDHLPRVTTHLSVVREMLSYSRERTNYAFKKHDLVNIPS